VPICAGSRLHRPRVMGVRDESGIGQSPPVMGGSSNGRTWHNNHSTSTGTSWPRRWPGGLAEAPHRFGPIVHLRFSMSKECPCCLEQSLALLNRRREER